MLLLCVTVLPLAVLFSSEQVVFQTLALIAASSVVLCLLGHFTDPDV